MLPVEKYDKDDDNGRFFRVYEVPKENIQYFYSKEMSDKELALFLRGLNNELIYEEIVLSSSPDSLCEYVNNYYGL